MGYLYRHIRLDTNEVFYIGISKSVKNYKRAYSKSQRSDFWKNIINQTDYKVEILLESDDYEFIKQKEIEFIALYGRRDKGLGTLCNLTDGGEGSCGILISEEQRKKISDRMKGENNPFYGKTHSPENIELIRESKTGTRHSEGQKELWSKNRSGKNHPQFGIPLTQERRDNISLSKIGIKLSEETRSRMSESRTGKTLSKEHILNLSKKVINELTQEIYDCPKDVAEIYGWNYKTFLNRLGGNAKNETNFKYL